MENTQKEIINEVKKFINGTIDCLNEMNFDMQELQLEANTSGRLETDKLAYASGQFYVIDRMRQRIISFSERILINEIK